MPDILERYCKNSLEAINSPRKGDVWTERFSVRILVLGTTENRVVFEEATSLTTKIKEMYKDDFKTYLSYTTMPDKTWCFCIERGEG